MSLFHEGVSILSLILLCIIVYFYSRQSPASELEMFIVPEVYNENDRNLYGIPIAKEFIKKDTAYISLVCKDYVDIYLDKGSKAYDFEVDRTCPYIGRADNASCLNLFHFEVPFSVENNDRLIFYHLNKIHSGFWAGHIYLNGKFYPTNSENFKILSIENRNIKRNQDNDKINIVSKTSPEYGFSTGCGRLGCYSDIQNKNLINHHFPGRKFSFEECKEIAESSNMTYFGLKNGGQCFSGNDIKLAQSEGVRNDNKCQLRNSAPVDEYKINGFTYKNLESTQSGGGFKENDLHSVSANPNIRECGNWPYLRIYKRSDGKGNGYLTAGCKSIKPEIGSSCTNNVFNRWVQYEFKLN